MLLQLGVIAVFKKTCLWQVWYTADLQGRAQLVCESRTHGG